MIRRNSFVISKALGNFLSASVMTSLAGQLAVTTDAVIVSHMVGPDALSAINIVMPLTMLFSCASILIGLGASILAAKAIGNHNKERVNRIFTIALIMLAVAGTAVSGLSYHYCNDIIGTIIYFS
jgi:Na+-driven multidrug efflux pump